MNLERNMDLFDRCKTDGGYFGQMRVIGDHYFTRPTLDPHPGTRMLYDGKEKIMWSINSYLGLAGNDEIAVDGPHDQQLPRIGGQRRD